ncbi:hypothetical protein [Idiomarina abyssalis]|mgnify:CR=1 FL=1|jgi:hypothetical protein|uniref:hypothetical protein n=1 Tax=Idiomarina abyssalis TaxID=86102 RepID=UPI00241E9694|nr:hypothetical protein [Idiomarina abyssalis]|tara:strand:- start:782 stop:1492 length:711 start_codon:yes stop_codon:yes gene_type:complete
MFYFGAHRKTKNFAKLHHLKFSQLYDKYRRECHDTFIEDAEKWLCSFPNKGSNFSYKNWSDNPFDLTVKNFVFFSNVLYLLLSVSCFATGKYKRSLHFRTCMSESISYSEHSGYRTALAWRLLNLSIVRDSQVFGFPEFSKNLRRIDEKDLASVFSYGELYHQTPKLVIDYELGAMVLYYPNEMIEIDFRVQDSLALIAENISTWILSRGEDYDWIGRHPFDREWIEFLETSYARV